MQIDFLETYNVFDDLVPDSTSISIISIKHAFFKCQYFLRKFLNKSIVLLIT